MMTLIYGRDSEVSRLVESTMPWVGHSFNSPAVGVVNEDNQLVGGVVYVRVGKREVSLSAGGIGNWLKSYLISDLIFYGFGHMAAEKLSCVTRKNDTNVRTLCRSLGFRKEGIIRRFFPDGSDAVYYGLFLEELKLRGDYGWKHRLWQSSGDSAAKQDKSQ